MQHRFLALGVLAVCFFVAWFFPRCGDGLLTRIEKGFLKLARRKALAIVVVMGGAILIRLCFLPILNVPAPNLHDEFSHLLAADTFAHGRLTNPSHFLWIFFDTFHVIQTPTYMSKYPPGDSLLMALGQILGHPWIGVLLSTGIMCGALLWMLQGWFPPGWALLGAIVAFFQIGLWTYWGNAYLGGPVAATGGALVMGALPRIFRHPGVRDALILALGVGILADRKSVV